MRYETDKYKTFTRRAIIVGGIKVSLLSLILGRYYYLQVIKSSKYSTLSDKNRLRLIIIPSERGKILDRNNKEIATSTKKFSLIYDQLSYEDWQGLASKIEMILERPLKTSMGELQKKLSKQRKNEYVVLEDNISWETFSKISEHSHILPGIDIIETTIRKYQNGEAFSHITGYIGIPSEQEAIKLTLPMFNELRIGKSGIEKIYNDYLMGTPGIKKVEVNVHGKYIREIEKKEPIVGDNLVITIDSDLQQFIHNILEFKEVNGSVVVMEVKTGEILAMHSSPTFDPNQFVNGVSKEYWESITKSKNYPLINGSTSIPYPPGSTFKIITGLAGLENGIDPKREFYCSGFYNLGNKTFRCAKHSGHGSVNLYDAIAQSCNPYFYQVGQIIGVNNIATMAKKLGYGTKTGIELPHEHPGLVADSQWKKRKYKADWYRGDTANISIGQGYMLVTPLQLATMTARVASGLAIRPTIIKPSDNINFEKLDISDASLQAMRKGMGMAVNDPRGTAAYHTLANQGFKFAGKTGTAQVAAMKFKNKSYNLRHHALFTSFGPIDDPEYIISVVIEHGEGGAKSAAPIAKQIYLKLIGQPTELDINIDSSSDED